MVKGWVLFGCSTIDQEALQVHCVSSCSFGSVLHGLSLSISHSVPLLLEGGRHGVEPIKMLDNRHPLGVTEDKPSVTGLAAFLASVRADTVQAVMRIIHRIAASIN